MQFCVMQIPILAQIIHRINDNEKNLLRRLILRVCCKQKIRAHAEEPRIKILKVPTL